DLGPAETIRCLGNLSNIEVFGVALALTQMNGADRGPRFEVGEIDEEDFVEATLSQKLRRKRLDVVGGGDDENGVGVLLHPGQQRAEHALGKAAVGALAG